VHPVQLFQNTIAACNINDMPDTVVYLAACNMQKMLTTEEAQGCRVAFPDLFNAYTHNYCKDSRYRPPPVYFKIK